MSERRFGILIASSQFPKEPKLEDLRCPPNDVDGLNEILVSKDHGEFTETFVFKNKPHHEVLRNINRVLNEVSKEDLVLVYYSGHGKLDRAGRLHLATADTELATLESTSIPVERIRSYVDVSSCTKVVLILDSCYGGAVAKDFFKGDVDGQLQALSSEGRGIYILSASTATQMATEKESDDYGLLTKHIIHGIKEGEADLDEDGRVSIADLYKYVQEKVPQESPQRPMHWGIDVFGEVFLARSGKTPREKRNREILDRLFSLAAERILPDDILDKARQVIALKPDELIGKLKVYDELLEQLLKKRLGFIEFIREWDKVGSEPVSATVKPSPPEPPSAEPEPTEPPPPKPKPAKPKPAEIKPAEPKPSEPTPPEPPKRKHILIIGGAIVFGLLLFLLWGLWSFSSHVRQSEVRSYLDALAVRISSLEKEVTIAKTSQKKEALEREMNLLTRKLENLEDRAVAAGVVHQLQALRGRLGEVGRQLAAVEPRIAAVEKPEEVKKQPEPVKTGRLFVQTEPENARVRILNIGPPYERGMDLEPGPYHVEVTAKGYVGKRQWIELAVGEDKHVNIRLAKVPVPQPAAPAGEVFTNSIGMKFVPIPSGKFMMGSSQGYNNERPVHEVTLTKPFYMQTTEVTQGQWKMVMGNNPSYFKNCGNDCPVENISWDDVQKFIGKLNEKEDTDKYRLPTEAEWEYAARAGSTTRYYFGDNESGLKEYAWYYDNAGRTTHPVGQLKPNKWGLYDMHGNVWELCQDWYDENYYSKSPERDPKGPSTDTCRVLRGGSWISLAKNIRSANRLRLCPADRGHLIGFRVARAF